MVRSLETRKTALIVEGGNSRCRELCLACAEQGFDIGFTYSGDREDADALVREIAALGAEASAFEVSRFAASELAEAVVQTAERLGGIDVLVYCNVREQGYETEGKLVLDLDEEDWDVAFARGAKGFFLVCKYALPYLIGRPGARIVAVDSNPPGCGDCALSEYVASRALHAAAEHIATEVSYYGVSATAKLLEEMRGWICEQDG